MTLSVPSRIVLTALLRGKPSGLDEQTVLLAIGVLERLGLVRGRTVVDRAEAAHQIGLSMIQQAGEMLHDRIVASRASLAAMGVCVTGCLRLPCTVEG